MVIICLLSVRAEDYTDFHASQNLAGEDRISCYVFCEISSDPLYFEGIVLVSRFHLLLHIL
jgi:hypothetical protein